MAHQNPGNINVRLGAIMALDELAVREGNLEVQANLQERMATYLSVYMTKQELAEFDAMPGLVYGTTDHPGPSPATVFRDLNRRQRFLLAIARQHGVFARAPDLEEGDGSIMDKPQPAPASEPEEVFA